MSKARCYKSKQGFTLIEVILAIAIFAIISLSSFTIFNTVITSDERAKLRNQRLNEFNRAFLLMERDFLQMARRTVRLNGEAPLIGYLHTSEQALFDETTALAFVRGGWTNPGLLLPRSDMQSVAYQLNESTLERLHFNFVDPVVGQEPKVRSLLTQVESLKFEFYQTDSWQEEFTGKGLPQAIAVIVETEDFGKIRRQFLVAGDYVADTNDDN